jgi:hypothetical protein
MLMRSKIPIEATMVSSKPKIRMAKIAPIAAEGSSAKMVGEWIYIALI